MYDSLAGGASVVEAAGRCVEGRGLQGGEGLEPHGSERHADRHGEIRKGLDSWAEVGALGWRGGIAFGGALWLMFLSVIAYDQGDVDPVSPQAPIDIGRAG